MRTLAIVALFTIALAVYQSRESATLQTISDARIEAYSVNFLVYQAALSEYRRLNPGVFGIIPDAALPTPLGYNNLGWTNRITGSPTPGMSRIYAYGSPTVVLPDEIAGHLRHISSVGVNLGGSFVSSMFGNYGAIIPAWLPNGAVVSIVEVRP